MSNTGLLTALLAVQSEAPTLPKDGTNPFYKSKYTPLDTIVEKIGPLLTKHGLVWVTLPGRDEHGDPALHYRLAHAETGERLDGTMPLLLTEQNPQGLGSAITYARRYSLCAVLNLVADDDDDGNAGSAGQAQAQAPARRMGATPASDAQKRRIRKDFKGLSLTIRQIKAIFAQAGVLGVESISTKQDVEAAVDGLAKHQASAVIDVLAQGALPDPEHPALDNDASGFAHPHAGAFGEPDSPEDDPERDVPVGEPLTLGDEAAA